MRRRGTSWSSTRCTSAPSTSRRGDGRHVRRRDREARASEAARGERLQIMPAPEFAGDVSWGYNPAHIFAVESAYGGPEGVQGLHQSRAQERDRGDPRRRLQPLRPERPRPLAVRRLERERQGRHLLLQRLAQRDALGRHPPRLRPPRGPPVHPRQRALLAGRVPPRRAALRHDALHPQRARRRGRRRRRARRRAGACCSGSTARSPSAFPGASPSPRTCATGPRSPPGSRTAARVSARNGTPSSSTRSARC